ncbi:aminotransferase class V-fold PLP-dependent enzyme [Moheibacter lacus]|uniref:Probable cysteine desulfurase n=1 Tax=Moheibacter lacus TaxID=2745851 RepID=A0A838ZSF0_9FLAO|nr:cysteine desulfurase [Moheibacter lacus]MBA5629659.1 cysteine desulfurase [Moheibacter lacus]
MNFDIQHIRSQFPILNREVNGNPLIYMDNAATSQKPKMVLDAIENYYEKFNANVHRGIHTISQEATVMMENAREKVRNFINAKHAHEIIFTKGTTEGINLVAHVLREVLKPGDEIITTEIEHHSNIVPWQMLCERTGAKLKYIPLDENGRLQVEKLDELLTEKTKLVTVNQISNALGVINPIEEIIAKAHQAGAWVLIDGAQSIPHTKVDVQELDADFFIFSGHKMYAPTGTGILYGKEEILNKLPPFHGGGEMIKEVWMDHSTYAGLPFKFEAGTPHIEGNIVFETAIDFINEIGIENIHQHENHLVEYTTEKLSELEEVIIYGKTLPRSGAVSFNLNLQGVHPSDVGMILDKKGIAVRTGHHCAQPIMRHFGIPGTVRVSFAVFNTKVEIDQMIAGVKLAIKMLG